MTNLPLQSFLNKIDVFDESSSCLVDASFVARLLKAMEKLEKCSKLKSFKDIIKNVNEANDLIDVDVINNDVFIPINDWNDIKENVERFIPYSASLEDAEKFKNFINNMR
jgi:hypothetical protein